MGRVDQYELMHLRRQLLGLRNQIYQRPITNPMRSVVPFQATCQIVGGQTSNGLSQLQYAVYGNLYLGAEQADMAYNPLTDTSLIAGLGIGYVYDARGNQGKLQLIRHSWLGFTDCFGGGFRVTVGTPYKLPVHGTSTLLAVYPIIGF